jgi:hypothetical protein
MATPKRAEWHGRGAWVALTTVVYLTLRCEPVSAQPNPQTEAAPCPTCSIADEQRSGIYLRVSVGLASMQLHNEFGADSELGGAMSFAIGYYVLPNLALSLGAYGANAYKFAVPTAADGSTTEVDARSLALGISLTYYFPLEFYAAIAPGVGWLLETAESTESRFNNAGFALDVIAGREWWIRGSWALGAGVQLILNTADKRVAGIDYAWSLGVLFTVTWN